MATRYRSNTPRFVDETIDGEALIMDMVQGNYYSAIGSSAFAWNAVATGVSTTDVASMLAARYGVTEQDAQRDVDAFVSDLMERSILVETTDAPAAPITREALDALVPQVEYTPPAIELFDDLADLILLDPVHDVTDAGWPQRTGEH
jgi:hypothetical protein